MAGIKRKEAVAFKPQAGNAHKKPKKEEQTERKLIEKVEPLETATDSDPIVESDTTSQSGEDDGTSWPSDDDGEPDEWTGVDEDSEDGGVEVEEQTAKTIAKGTAANGAPNSASSVCHSMSQ